MSRGRVLIYGGMGSLGSACVAKFKSNNYWVVSIDTKDTPNADLSIIIDKNNALPEQQKQVMQALDKVLEKKTIDAIFCVAGGWTGGNAAQNLLSTSNAMWKSSVNPSIITASVAARYLKSGGMLILTGANSALEATPNMIGYGLAKAVVHNLVKSLSSAYDAITVGVLPQILSTDNNKAAMPNADFSTWTPLEFVTDIFLRWTLGNDKPENGSLLKIITKNNSTNIVICK